ncbi:MAG: hypothetical protein AAFY88_05905 [Acidobacteriota bacterium]
MFYAAFFGIASATVEPWLSSRHLRVDLWIGGASALAALASTALVFHALFEIGSTPAPVGAASPGVAAVGPASTSAAAEVFDYLGGFITGVATSVVGNLVTRRGPDRG